MSEKKPLILFSGGIESTTLLYTYFPTGADTLEIKLTNSFQKVPRETKARDNIYDLIAEKNEYNRNRSANHRFTAEYTLGNFHRSMKLSQPLVWFIKAVETVNPDTHSSVMIGYGADDDIGSVIPHLVAAWGSMWQVLRPEDELVPLEFPLILHEKRNIVARLPDELLKLTFSCEGLFESADNLIGCGQCTPCRERFQAMVSAGRINCVDPHTLHNTVKHQFGRDVLDTMLDALINPPAPLPPKLEEEKDDDTLEKTSDIPQSPLGSDLPGPQPAGLVQLPDQASVLGDAPVHAETAAVPA